MLPPALRYLRSNDAMSMPCHLLQVCVRRGAGERAIKFAAGISRATNTLLNPS